MNTHDTEALMIRRQKEWERMTADQQLMKISDAILRVIDAERRIKRQYQSRNRNKPTNDILFPQKARRKS